MLFTNSYLPRIPKPTGITSHTSKLIGHIYINCPIEKVSAGIATVDISDQHFAYIIFKSSVFLRDYR